MNPLDRLGLGALTSAGQTWSATLAGALSRWGVRAAEAALLAVLFALLYRLTSGVLRRLAGRFPGMSGWARLTDGALRLACLAFFLVAGASLFPVTARFVGPLARVSLITLLLYLGWEISQRLLVRTFARFGIDASLELLVANLVRTVWLAIGLYLIFQQFGINLLPILGGLGIVGVAIGFAAQDLLSNLISGITLLLDRPFTLGDWIRVGHWEGQVQRLTLRTTRLRTRDNEHISIPNSKVAGNDVVNLSAGGPLRIRSALGVSYAADVGAARRALLSALSGEPLVLRDPAPRVAVTELGESSVNLELIYWIAQDAIARRPLVQQRVLEAAKGALDTAGIEIPFPQRVLHLVGTAGLHPGRPEAPEGPPSPS